MRDLPNLDLLRAFAVVSVVAEHALLAFGVQTLGYWQVRWMGIVGVLLFFIHTSLVLMWSLERRPQTLDFYIRRAFRIYPLALLAIAVTLLFHAPVAGRTNMYFAYAAPPSFGALVAALLLVPNLFRGYGAMSVLWSLPYEVEMYVCLPALFFFIQRNLRMWPLVLFWCLEVALCRPLFHGAEHNFFLVVPYFLPGVMAYVGFTRRRARLPSWLFPLFLLLLWAVFMLHPGWREADVLCLVAGLALPAFHQVRSAWLKQTGHALAKYSYGLYLMHPFAIVLGVYLLPHRSLALQLSVILVSLTILSVGAYHALELPMIRLGSRLAGQAARFATQRQEGTLRIPEAEIQ